MNNDIGDRMKGRYEMRSQVFLPRRTYVILRVDGKAFHTFTHGMDTPFDSSLVWSMDEAARILCNEVQGANFAFSQSDEVSLLLTDFAVAKTDAWFDYNIQKMASVGASLMTAAFNTSLKSRSAANDKWALFDARVFAIPDPVEVENYFIWRQKDWYRNSVTMLARSLYSHKELNEKSCADMHEMIHQKGQNWADLPDRLKNGGIITKTAAGWLSEASWTFTQERERLTGLIPRHGYDMPQEE